MRNRYDRDDRRRRRPAARRAAVPRLHRGREACDAPESSDRGPARGRGGGRPRARDQYTEEQYNRMSRDLPDAELGAHDEDEGLPRSRSSRGARLERRALRDRDSMRGKRGMGRRPRFSRERELEEDMGYEDEGMDDLGYDDAPADDDMMDLDLDAILEVDEEEITEEGGCPAGCVPEEDVDKALDQEEGEEDEKEEKDDDADDKSKDDEKKDDDDKDDDKKEDKDDDDKKDDKKKDDDDDDKKEAAVDPVVEAASEPTEAEAAPAPIIDTAKWAPLFSEADIKKLDTKAEVVMVPFFEQEDPSYAVLANSRPVGEIRMSDLDKVDPKDRYALFTDEAFPKGIGQAIEQLGASNVLGDLNLRYYANLVTQRQADSAAKTAVQADLEEAFQTRAADLKQKFINNVLLAVQASNKNIFLNNPLRDAIRENFRGAGVPDAVVVDLFEDAMQKAGADYFMAMVEKADEWLGFEPEALAQIEATVTEANYSHPADRGMDIEADVVGAPPSHQIPRTMAPAPRQAVAPTEWDGAEEDVRNVMRNAGTLNRGRNGR